MIENDAQVEAMRREIYRRMSGGEKIALAMRMREQAIAITRDAIRRRHPEFSEDEVEFAVRKRYLPKGLAELTEPMRREHERRQRSEPQREQTT